VAKAAPEAVQTKPDRTRLHGALRILGLLAFIVIGSVAALGRPANGVYYNGTGDIIEALVIGALIAITFLVIVGTVGYWISRGRHHHRTWKDVTFGRTAMVVTLVLLILSAAGQAAQREEAVNKANPNPEGSLTERVRANRDAAAWGQKFIAPDKEEHAWLSTHRAFYAALQAQGNVPSTRAKAEVARAHAAKAVSLARAIPDFPEHDLNAARDSLVSVLQLSVRAYDLYLTGLHRNARSGIPLPRDKESLAFLDEGDALLNKAVRLSRQFRERFSYLDAKYGIP
jgi:hypothetical protein